MTLRIEDYALVGDTQTAALVGRDGFIDWLCCPRFDSGACFAALLGDPSHGRWLLAPEATPIHVRRRYLGHSLVLETEFETDTGVVRVLDCMPPRHDAPDLVRVVEGVSGSVRMQFELIVRFDYGLIVPWVRTVQGVWRAIGGPDALSLHTPIETRGEGMTTKAEFTVTAGDRVPFVLVWHASHLEEPELCDGFESLEQTRTWWEDWCAGCTYQGPWRDDVLRSLVVLKALTFAPTGGIIAAATTSLPECIGSVRNWDYRYCWLRDATFTLYAFLLCGFTSEALAWRNWLLRAVAGDPPKLQTMYGAAGERRLREVELDWLPGYEGSRPVRIGNAATQQLQLDVYGEVIDTLHVARRAGVEADDHAWSLETALLEYLEHIWSQPDEGIWEVRGPRRHFTHSKVMAWVAFDRAVKSIETLGLAGPLDRWRSVRDVIHDDVCRRGYDAGRGAFTQYYRSHQLDASLLMIPLVGFLPPADPRVIGTVAAIERELLEDGYIRRYPASPESERVDGLPSGEGVFLPCTFWLADNYAMQGRTAEAERLFERLLALRNDVGLLAEEYDPHAHRMLGNFPQAFTHVALVNTAVNLSPHTGPAQDRPNA